ncbi:MAG: hypothetical protein ACOYBY_02045 [Dermatophilaceae bacterium]
MSEATATEPLPAVNGIPITHPSRARSIVAGLCFILAAVLTTPAAVAFWGQRTITDTQRYIETVGPLVNTPQVQQAIGDAAIQTFEQQVNVEAILDDVFSQVLTDRPRLQRLVGPLASGVNSLIEREVREFIASDAFADLWVVAQTRAQQALVRVMEGDSTGAVSLQGDKLVLDIGDVLDQVKQRLIARGLTVLQNVPIPEVNKQIVLMDAPQLAQARTIYAFSKPLAVWLLPTVALLYLLAFLLARRRPFMGAAIGASLALNGLLTAFALTVAERLFVNAFSGTVLAPASTVIYTQLVAYLVRGWQVFLWLGLILLAAGWFAGVTSSGAGTRRWASRELRAGGSHVGGLVPAGRWVGANAGWLRWVAVVIGGVVLLWGLDTSLSRLIWSTVLVVVLLALIELLAGAGEHRLEGRAEGVAGSPPPAAGLASG